MTASDPPSARAASPAGSASLVPAQNVPLQTRRSEALKSEALTSETRSSAIGDDLVHQLVEDVLADPDQLQLFFQPIVSLQEGLVVGYEALSRFFPQRPSLQGICIGPDRVFAAADRMGLGAELEAIPIRRAIGLRGTLPPNCFLTFNVSPHLVTQDPIHTLLMGAARLDPLILELTEQTNVDDLSLLLRLRDDIADRGGFLALDDAGAGYSGLQHMTHIRPHMIKLDRTLVCNADTDEVKLALIELLGEFAGRIDAWLLAEGIETLSELEACVRLGVPLGQGFLLGRPSTEFTRLTPEVAAQLRGAVQRNQLTGQVASLREQTWVTREPRRQVSFINHRGRVGLVLDDRRRAVELLIPVDSGNGQDTHRPAAISLRVPTSENLVALARRMMARSPNLRFDPAVCVDDHGRATGVVRVERVLTALAAGHRGLW